MKDIASTLYNLKTIQSLGTYLFIGQKGQKADVLIGSHLNNHFDTEEVQEHTRRIEELSKFLQSLDDVDNVIFNLRTIQALAGYILLVQEGQILDVHIDADLNESFNGQELQERLCRIEYLSKFLKSL